MLLLQYHPRLNQEVEDINVEIEKDGYETILVEKNNINKNSTIEADN